MVSIISCSWAMMGSLERDSSTSGLLFTVTIWIHEITKLHKDNLCNKTFTVFTFAAGPATLLTPLLTPFLPPAAPAWVGVRFSLVQTPQRPIGIQAACKNRIRVTYVLLNQSDFPGMHTQVNGENWSYL